MRTATSADVTLRTVGSQ